MAFDLDKVIAEQPPSKSRAKQFEFVFDGETYKLPNTIDMLALRAVDEQELVTALRKLLSYEDFARIQRSAKTMTQTTLYALFDAYYQHLVGLAAGESGASSRRSTPTPRPSGTTSKRTAGSRSKK